MPIILLGILAILILLVFMYYNGEFGSFAPKGRPKPPQDEPKNGGDDDDKKVIELPTDIEKEKKKRHVKTGKN